MVASLTALVADASEVEGGQLCDAHEDVSNGIEVKLFNTVSEVMSPDSILCNRDI